MIIPGMEPTISFAVWGRSGQGHAAAIDRLTTRVGRRDGHAILYRNPFLAGQQWLPTTAWTLIHTPGRIVGLMVMSLNDNSVADVAWHLPQTDANVVVVPASDPQLPRDLLLFAALSGQRDLMIWLVPDANIDTDAVERELRLSLMMMGYPGDDVPIIRGRIDDNQALDQLWLAMIHIRTPTFDEEGPTRFLVRSYRSGVSGARGRLVRGMLQRGAMYHVFYRHSIWAVRLRSIHRFGQKLEEAATGHNLEVVAIASMPTPGYELAPGAILADPGTVRPTSRFTARLTLWPIKEGGRTRYVTSGYSPGILLPTVRGRARLEWSAPRRIEPGETFDATATLCNNLPALIEEGDSFLIRERGRAIGQGIVTGR